MIKKLCFVFYEFIIRSKWIRNQVDNEFKFIRRINQNLDLCNLGSNSSRYAFTYEKYGLNGENWALGPQTLSYDFKILKNYHSYLKNGAYVLITLCPFSSCVIDFEENKINDKYYSFLNPIYILNYSEKTKELLNNNFEKSYHITFFKVVIKRIIKNLFRTEKRYKSKKFLYLDSIRWVKNWSTQFQIENLNEKISEKNANAIAYNTNLLIKMIDFCLKRNLKPILILPPISKQLSSKFTVTSRENYIYSFVRNANIANVPFLNYIDNEELSNDKLFFNSYYLNNMGRKIFSKIILRDIGVIK